MTEKHFYDLMIEVRKHCISKDETRRFLQGVYFDERGISISTDGKVLSHSRLLFEEKLKGLLIDENFKVIEREFPKWQGILPKSFQFSAQVQLNKNLLKKGKFGLDRVIYFTGEKFLSEKPESFVFAIDSKLLKPLLNNELLVKIEWNNSLGPIKFSFYEDKPDEFMIVMPIKV